MSREQIPLSLRWFDEIPAEFLKELARGLEDDLELVGFDIATGVGRGQVVLDFVWETDES